MKKIAGLFITIIAVLTFSSCDPISPPIPKTGAVTMADIEQYVKVDQQIINGKKCNYFSLSCEHLSALSSFEYGTGTYVGTNSAMTDGKQYRQCFVVPGNDSIVFTALNGDGTQLHKTFNVTIDSCYNVPKQWGYLCGEVSKTWTWDEDTNDEGDFYYMGEALDHTDVWWSTNDGLPYDESEWLGATMTFTLKGTVLTKTKTDGSTVSGRFSIDLTTHYPEYDKNPDDPSQNYSIGELVTKGITVLNGNSSEEDGPWKGGPVDVYEIVKLTNTHLMLSSIEMTPGPDWAGFAEEGWGEATWWLFKTVDE